ncbi:hypothetical protein FEM03_11640 [Phragmitibacter flavus]|uniref:Uncharacterized protein n=1 Tax=Phragmitibacter flavus TaxID=2576071 RepID=A0A5R8KDJ6_9BACT|nr:hypothetical protein [Phragmitibacter flavus]TLD70380.1 hypothetical protein FEM03_11640 [Phragmitibacter flavus]
MDHFYADAAVRERLMEFLGGDSLEKASAIYITKADGQSFDPRALHLPTELNRLLDQQTDVSRSLADEESLLLHLDLEYVNFDSPLEAYRDPLWAFELQEPVVRVIEALLLKWGIRPLHVITGQGHHFVWRVRREGEVAESIRKLGPAPELAELCQLRVPAMFQSRIDLAMQEAFGGLGLLLEHVAQEVKVAASKVCAVPVEITAVHVGPGATGAREMISIDISEYGDPLHTRMVRMPFTNYLKPGLSGMEKHLGLEGNSPALRAIPLHEMDYRGALEVRKVEDSVHELARRACVRIPEQSEGTRRLLDDYLASRLRRFHEHFYSTRHDPPERWSQTYGQLPMAMLPPCVRRVLEDPNDRLLKPAGMQLVTRTLMAQGWHPRHVAGYIRSIFENSAYGWPLGWADYEAGTRADFYVRAFAGLYATGVDRLVDFNCVSTFEKGFCGKPEDAGACLDPLREQLLKDQCL